jgi:hypothetical protein
MKARTRDGAMREHPDIEQLKREAAALTSNVFDSC